MIFGRGGLYSNIVCRTINANQSLMAFLDIFWQKKGQLELKGEME